MAQERSTRQFKGGVIFEAYSIGVSLRLHNLISPQLVLLAKEFEKLELLTVSLNKSLGKIAIDSSAFRSLTTATNATNRALERASISAERLQGHLSAVHRLGGAMASPSLLPPPGGRGGGSGGGFGGRHNGGGFHGGNIHMGPGGVGLGTVGMAAGDAFVPLAVTAGLLYAGKSLFESAKDLDTERQRFKLFGLSNAQNTEAFKFASGMHIYGMSQTENMRNFREAQGVFREAGLEGSAALDGAKLAAPILSKLNALDSSLDDESAARSHSSNLAMLRYVESAGGLKSQDEFNRLANIGYRLKVGSGDTVDWQQLQQFQKRGGSAAINISGEGMARLEPSISTLGGSSSGTALATGFGRLQGIVKGLPVSVISELLENGIWDKSKVELNSKGGIAKFLDPKGPMSADRSKLLSENPEGFYEQIIRPVYAKMNLDAAGVIRQNALIYGRTGGALANEWEKQLATIQRAVAAFDKTKGIDAATKQLPDSLSGQQKEFEAAWTDFKTQFGTVVLPFFSGILKGGAAIFRGISTPQSHFVLPSPGYPDGHWEDANGAVTGGKKLAGLAGRHWVDNPGMPGSGHWDNGDAGTGSRFVANGANSPITVKTQINMDGRKVADAVTAHQARGVASPYSGANFDGTMHPATVVMNQGH